MNTRESADGAEQVRRHMRALRRSTKLIVAIVAYATLAALLLSLMSPATYRATARLVQGTGAAPLNSDVVERQLATDKALVGSESVLRAAATRLPGMTPAQLARRISTTVSAKANLIDITAAAGGSRQAARIANSVARSFLAARRRSEQHDLARQIRGMERQLVTLGHGSRDERRALQRRIDELTVGRASAGSDLRLAEAAAPPAQPSSPRPMLAVVLAFFASLTIAVLIALAREHLSPRVRGTREAGALLSLPVLAAIPAHKRNRGRRAALTRAAERDAFQSLRTAVELATPPGDQKVLVVTSGAAGEGKTTVGYQLARSLVDSGQSVLLVDGDLRRPALHTYVGARSAPGVSDVLAAAAARRIVPRELLARAIRTVGADRPRTTTVATLAFLPSGKPREDPAVLLTRDVIASLFGQIRELEYEWVVVDSPPLLGAADAALLAGAADALLVVSRLGVTTLEQLQAEREVLDRLEVEAVGVAVVGAPVAPGVYEPGAAWPVTSQPRHAERRELRRLPRARAVPTD